MQVFPGAHLVPHARMIHSGCTAERFKLACLKQGKPLSQDSGRVLVWHFECNRWTGHRATALEEPCMYVCICICIYIYIHVCCSQSACALIQTFRHSASNCQHPCISSVFGASAQFSSVSLNADGPRTGQLLWQSPVCDAVLRAPKAHSEDPLKASWLACSK